MTMPGGTPDALAANFLVAAHRHSYRGPRAIARTRALGVMKNSVGRIPDESKTILTVCIGSTKIRVDPPRPEFWSGNA